MKIIKKKFQQLYSHHIDALWNVMTIYNANDDYEDAALAGLNCVKF